jgi:hypothetical protein
MVVILEQEINCAIFRHAVFKNGIDVPPHTSKELMYNLIKEKLIFGCGFPFRLEKKEESYVAVESDWV